MKHNQLTTTSTLPVMALCCLLLLLTACQQNVDSPSISCPGMQMTTNIENQHIAMNYSKSLLFRERTDTGGLKYLSVETVSDSIKIVLNITDGMYDEAGLLNDSLHLKTYTFSRLGRSTGGLVAVALRDNNGQFDFITTDSSSVTINRMNLRTQTLSGSFYFVDNDKKMSGTGTFANACYVSLQ